MKPSVSRGADGLDSGAPRLGLALSLVVIALGALLFLNSGFFDLDEVHVTGLTRLTRAEVLALAGLEKPVNIFKVVPGVVCRKISSDPRVRAVKVERRLPGKVSIHIDERVPLFGIPYGGELILIGSGGVVLPSDPGLDSLPVALGLEPKPYRLGERVTDAGVLAVVDLLTQASPEILDRISEIKVGRQDEITMCLSGGVIVDFGGAGFARRKMEALAILWADSLRRNKKLAHVNLHSPESPSVRWAD